MGMTISEEQAARVLEKAEELMANPSCTVTVEAGTKDATQPGDAIRKIEYDGSYKLTIFIPPEEKE